MTEETIFNIETIIKEYDKKDFDFGFSSESVDDGTKWQNQREELEREVDKYQKRLQSVEKIILPFLTKLYKTADQPIIKWPNRGPVIEDQIKKIIKLTRG